MRKLKEIAPLGFEAGTTLTLASESGTSKRCIEHEAATQCPVLRECAERHSGLSPTQACGAHPDRSHSQDTVLNLSLAPGYKLFVDYARIAMPVIDRLTGEIMPAKIFVATLGHSGYTFVEATATKTLPDWLGSHRRALEFLGGIPAAVVVSDDPMSCVNGTRPKHQFAQFLYQELAAHYGFDLLLGSCTTPHDKTVAESAVLSVEHQVLEPLRDRQHFSLAELNDAMAPLLEALNVQLGEELKGSRRGAFDTVEYNALKPLPVQPYEYAIWKTARVHLDYHVEHDRRYYSVPHTLMRKDVDLCITEHSVQILHCGQLVASHVRGARKGQFVTNAAHRPTSEHSPVEMTHRRLLQQAEAIGEGTAEVIRRLMQRRKHRDESLRSNIGILRLAKDFGPVALENACRRALRDGTCNYGAVRTLLVRAATPAG